MNAGERAIVREERRMEKERKRRIEQANKMLIPVGGNTQNSLGLMAVDPDGVFRMENSRWLKFYEISGALQKLADAAADISGRIRITFKIREDGRATCHLTLIESGEIYADVRKKMSQDEEAIQKVCIIHPLTVDEAMDAIAGNFNKEIRFSYASAIRGKKDWKKEFFSEIRESITGFEMGSLFGEGLSVVSFPEDMEEGLMEKIKNLGCAMYVAVDINGLTDEEQSDFNRALEKKYNRRLLNARAGDCINLSVSIVLLCDSRDAERIVEETLISLFLRYGIVLAPAFHSQKRATESVLSLGLVDQGCIRNVRRNVAEMMIGGDTGGDAEIQV